MSSGKYKKLQKIISRHERVVTALSGGVDSTLLAKASYDILGDNALAVTIDNGLMSSCDVENAAEIASEIGVRHQLVTDNFLEDERLAKNPPSRCYICKKRIAGILKNIAGREEMGTLFDGTNADDVGGDRPGIKALTEGGVETPLAEAGFTKDDIREEAKKLGLSNHDRYSNTCLATRIPYGRELTREKLEQIDQAEGLLRDLGIKQFRVRNHCHIARIESFKEDFPLIIENSDHLLDGFRNLGFSYVNLDLKAYDGK
ncbi:MAG: ATP-dependent sacrificial sulfur transferase LarE [Candidatus Altiarchaeota archaeon]|nr:ATP-dependent sacrificial sulfur transferase LarE [Candidatus Altiarchaeota archaeon]